MNNPKTYRYTPTHEWANLEGDVCTVGVTKFAADQLTDITYLELPEVGQAVTAGKDFGKVETVKAVSDLYAPVSGEVVAVNADLIGEPSNLTRDPFASSWIVKIKLAPGATLNHLLTVEQYEKQLATEGH
jgi:glycine cleavage system H protein